MSGYPNQYSGYGTDDPTYGAGSNTAGPSDYDPQPSVVAGDIWTPADTGYSFYDPSFYTYMQNPGPTATGDQPGGSTDLDFTNSPLYSETPEVDDGGSSSKKKSKAKHSGFSGGGGSKDAENMQRCPFPDCDREFTHTWEYNKHVKQHERPQKCDVCGASKAHRRDLDRHYVVHHPDRALAKGLTVERSNCWVKGCSETFARKDHLKRHLKNKHGIIEKEK